MAYYILNARYYVLQTAYCKLRTTRYAVRATHCILRTTYQHRYQDQYQYHHNDANTITKY
eukprot:7973547-Lingulodinium_polyedra.AAC.1